MSLIGPHDLDQFIRSGAPPVGYPINERWLFAPEDEVHGALVAAFSSACSDFAGSEYGYTDAELDGIVRRMLDDAHFPVTLCLDATQEAGHAERLLIAKYAPGDLGNHLVVGRSARGDLNHTKLQVLDGLLVISGSTNLSLAGEQKQNNECRFTWDAQLAHRARVKIDVTFRQMQAQMQAKAAMG